MNVRDYRIVNDISPLDFQADSGMVESSVSYQSEPKLNGSKLLLEIINSYIVSSVFTNKAHEALKVKSVYEMPANEIKSREDIYEFYKDSILSLKEAYEEYRISNPEYSILPNARFSTPSIENYKPETDRVLLLLNQRN